MADDVIERLGFMRFEPHRALIIGDRSGTLAAALQPGGSDLATPESIDFEHPVNGGPFDLIVSLTGLQTVNDLPGALIHLRHALVENGLLIACIVGGGSLPVLRRAMLEADGERPAARIHPQVDDRAASALLQRAGFGRQVVDRHTLTVRYNGLAGLVSDLRDQALGSALADRAPPLSRRGLAKAAGAFSAQADDDGRISEKFEIITMTAWKT